jgi:hypothetical protein
VIGGLLRDYRVQIILAVVRQKPKLSFGAGINRLRPREKNTMSKSISAIAGLTAILSLGSLISAYGGGATSAPSKYDNASQNQWRAQATSYPITEFSSSSAKASKKPKH